MDKRLKTVGRCIKSMFCNWDERGLNEGVLSDIECDLEHALKNLQNYMQEERDRRNAAYDAKPPFCPNCNGEMEASGDCFFCGYSQPIARV